MDATVTENQKSALNASKAEVHYLKGDEATALIYLQQAFDKKALG